MDNRRLERAVGLLVMIIAAVRGQQNFIGQLSECLAKRSFVTAPLVCSCPSGKPFVIDLGKGHYPRYLTSLECIRTPCSSPPFMCNSQVYKVNVLKRRDPELLDNNTRYDAKLPKALQATWNFVSVPVIVACVCSL